MSSLGVALPLSLSSVDGFKMIKTFKTLIKQNLKMLILTIPGERVMFPDYGVGIKTYLFSNFGPATYSEIDEKIREQVQSYMPIVNIKNIFFDGDQDTSYLKISIEYAVPTISNRELLEFTI
tara:strand:+ start:326 stop:691 length:366 start_codon:yes stop_codon:yes gene_type:complete